MDLFLMGKNLMQTIDRKAQLQREILEIESAIVTFETEKTLPPGVKIEPAAGSLFEQIKASAELRQSQEQRDLEIFKLVEESRRRLTAARTELHQIEASEQAEATERAELATIARLKLLADEYNSIARKLEELTLQIVHDDGAESMRLRRCRQGKNSPLLFGRAMKQRVVFSGNRNGQIITFEQEKINYG